MDARTITAIFLMLLIYIYFFQPKPVVQEPPKAVQTSAQAPTSSVQTESISEIAKSEVDSQIFELRNSLVTIKISATGVVQSVEFNNYQDALSSSNPKVLSFNKAGGFNSQTIVAAGLSGPWKLVSHDNTQIVLAQSGPQMKATRTITLRPDQYFLDFKEEVENVSSKSNDLRLKTRLQYSEPPPDDKKNLLDKFIAPTIDYHEALYWVDQEIVRDAFKDLQNSQKAGEILYGGFSEKYFYSGIAFKNFSAASVSISTEPEKLLAAQTFETLTRTLAPGEKTTFEYGYYLGPKDIRLLSEAQVEMREVINYGSWLGPIARVLLALLHFFYGWVANYGVAIILLTIVVKGLLFPLAFKSAIAMRKMQLIQPKMKALQEKYKADKQKLQMELMSLYRTEKVNPIGGCLPLLLQMPVFFALYRVFYLSIEFRHQPLFGWISDLSAHDPYFVTPVLMTLIMWYQMKITPQPAMSEENEMVRVQKTMMKIMPVMFGAFSIFLPAGLNIYLLTNVLISLIQQIYLNRYLEQRFPMPLIPAKSAAK